MDSCCRVCAQDSKQDLIPISYETESVTIEKMITFCAGVEIDQTDLLPKNCCERCVEGLYIAYSIIKQCQKSDKKLRQIVSSQDNIAKNESCAKDTDNEEDRDSTSDDIEDDIPVEPCEETRVTAIQSPVLSTTCCACRADFETVEALTDHIKKIHEPEKTNDCTKKPYQCDICFKRYFKKTSLNRHKRMAISAVGVRVPEQKTPTDHRCCGCRKDFDSLDRLKQHSLADHTASRVTSDEAKPYECEICFKRYSNKTSLARHFRERFLDRQIRTIRRLATNQCCGCRQKFITKDQLMRHSKQVHEPDRLSKGSKQFECGICFNSYSSKEAFERHKLGNTIDQLYQCQQCSKTFVKRIMLRYHEQKYHNGVVQDVIGPYQCTRCGKTFMQHSSLTNHEKVHDQSERFECSICQKHFFSKGNLQTHMKLHASPSEQRDARYECEICLARFKTPNYLEVHARVHTGEKPYECKYCSKRFAHASGHKRHLLTHSGVKPYSCHFCNREFSNRTNMLIHEKGHGTERTAKCDICEKDFVHVRYLRKHRKRHFS
ncbi:zinc finger protein OZF-like [Wyeomyia smithii]|uniref:zinc finger protein OZF-like n=1 Tax=Wyeomyia smithii TaxID=174621 RepID=UPI002467CD22|nr:zinc finger protein OZF-like [Wyeomyia smithii]